MITPGYGPSVRRLGQDGRRLIELFHGLETGEREMLLSFAEFLATRGPRSERPARQPCEPLMLPRPDNETVIAAIKRLSRTYPMLEREALLGEASSLMSAHLLQGRAAREVIDELETLFASAYTTYRAAFDACRA